MREEAKDSELEKRERVIEKEQKHMKMIKESIRKIKMLKQ